MSIAYSRGMTLAWSSHTQEENRFNRIVLITFLLALLLGIGIPLIELPEKERFKRQTLPPRLAQLILEQKQKPPPPKPKKVKIPEKKKPEPKPKKKPEPEKKPEPKVAEAPPKQVEKKPPPPKQVAQKQPRSSLEEARKKAASSGLLAFADELADLRETPAINNVQQVKTLTRAGDKAAKSSRSVITSGVSQGSGGINTASLSRDTGGRGLSSRTTTQVSNSVVASNGSGVNQAGSATGTRGKGKNHKANRTREEIQLVFDQNKGAVYALYNRALRKDPTLRGKVVLELTIAPSGKVTACKILSSELNDKTLERKLISRIKLFKFPSKDVDVAVVSYPIDFLPS